MSVNSDSRQVRYLFGAGLSDTRSIMRQHYQPVGKRQQQRHGDAKVCKLNSTLDILRLHSLVEFRLNGSVTFEKSLVCFNLFSAFL